MNENDLWKSAKSGKIAALDQALTQIDDKELLQMRNSEGDTLAHIAARKGHLDYVKKIQETGFDLNTANRKGKTLVHEASQNAQLPILKYLRYQGADFHLMTNEGDNVLDLAKKPEIATYLEEVLYEAPATSSKSTKKPKAKKQRGHQRFSDLKEVKKKESVIPSEEPILRTNHIHHLTSAAVSLPICQLKDVGWDAANQEALGFPKRPDWRMLGLHSAEALHAHEEALFRGWLGKVEGIGKNQSICSFERNLEYWRQLWRVLEKADLCLIILDARNPLLHLNLTLLSHICNDHQKKTLVCLNKADLIEEEVLIAWKQYLSTHLGLEAIHCSCKDEGESKASILDFLLSQKISLHSASDAIDVTVREVIKKNRDELLEFRKLQNQRRKQTRRIKDHQDSSSCSSHSDDDDDDGGGGGNEAPKQLRQDTICLSIIGEPNVGKSSFLNYLLGVKKVGVSSHPGRTKHLQTHLLCPNLLLCDCPGIVFPKINVPFPMQVLFGCFPIARCQDVYSVVGYLAQHISPPLPQILKLEPEDSKNDKNVWSVEELCEALAEKHHWMTHKGGRLDIYRAANSILRNALAGQENVVLRYWPPDDT